MDRPDTTLYRSPWPAIERWDQQIVAAENQVYADTGVWVPSDTVKAIMQIETGGNWPDPPNSAGAAGLMQVTSSTLGSYDMGRVVSDPYYSAWAGVNELALREKSSGFLPWRNVAVGYFSGHYTPTGASDGNSTDQQYQDQYDRNVQAMRPGADNGLPPAGTPYGNPVSGAAGSIARLAGRLAVFVLALALAGLGLWALTKGGESA